MTMLKNEKVSKAQTEQNFCNTYIWQLTISIIYKELLQLKNNLIYKKWAKGMNT
jgi:hypothetical protein